MKGATSVAFGVILFAAVAATAWSNNFCSYKDTNQLVWDPQFQEAIKGFFGGLRDEHFSPGERVAAQASERLGGPPENLLSVGDGLTLAAACKAHSCPEQAAAIIDCPSTIVAVAIVRYYQQCYAENGVDRCEQLPTVTMFFRDPQVMSGRVALEQWFSTRSINWGEDPPPPVILEYRRADGTMIRPAYVIPGHATANYSPR